jgi:bifunctional non-homologous end joining protein LigD
VSHIPAYRPQLAQLVKSAPSGDEWVHELKYDGYRIGCRIDHGRVTLISRKGNDWTGTFPEIARGAAALKVETALIDGEVCALADDGKPSFQLLQNLASSDRRRLVYFAFDLLFLNGRSLVADPLEARKAALRGIVRGSRIKFAEHLDADGRRPGAKPAASASKASCRSRGASPTRAASAPDGSRPSASTARSSSSAASRIRKDRVKALARCWLASAPRDGSPLPEKSVPGSRRSRLGSSAGA